MPTNDPRFKTETILAGQSTITVPFPSKVKSIPSLVVCDEEDDIDVTVTEVTLEGFTVECTPTPHKATEIYWMIHGHPRPGMPPTAKKAQPAQGRPA